MASFISQYFVADQGRAALDLTGTSVTVCLVDGTFALTATDQYLGDGTLGEVSATGYTGGHGNAGRRTITGITATLGASGITVYWDGADPTTWSSVASGATINGAVLHVQGASDDTTAKIIAFYDLTDTPTNGSDITLSWNASGFLKYTRATGS